MTTDIEVQDIWMELNSANEKMDNQQGLTENDLARLRVLADRFRSLPVETCANQIYVLRTQYLLRKLKIILS